jgi:hypothetical protein
VPSGTTPMEAYLTARKTLYIYVSTKRLHLRRIGYLSLSVYPLTKVNSNEEENFFIENTIICIFIAVPFMGRIT